MWKPLALGLVLLWPRASGADALLGTIPMGSGGGTSSAAIASIDRIAFEFGYSEELNGAPCVVHRVGCEGMAVGSAAGGMTYTFTSANSQWFPEIATRLTNGTNEGMAIVIRMLSGGVMKFGAGGGGIPEQQTFGTASDLTGNTITAIKLTLNTFRVGDATLCGGQPGGLCYDADMVWRIYGFHNDTPAIARSWGSVKSSYR